MNRFDALSVASSMLDETTDEEEDRDPIGQQPTEDWAEGAGGVWSDVQ